MDDETEAPLDELEADGADDAKEQDLGDAASKVGYGTS